MEQFKVDMSNCYSTKSPNAACSNRQIQQLRGVTASINQAQSSPEQTRSADICQHDEKAKMAKSRVIGNSLFSDNPDNLIT